ncbi:vWA domain-containing protein [Chenggangzhangella methanolivorans]|uniref:VWA domain-containing protein n=1 Tax=Chenggangzhangella methanolivorans TaxID=1437009 RepID=A0A9E6RDF9_9HYPH|nr:vWA domain-containing protein [Chenggangzhangella methanolivorans]QZN99045.1 VWA domain-containing protein [Chenggangzhangella methanolivorans]
MSALGFDHLWPLLLLALGALPFLASPLRLSPAPSDDVVPPDPLSAAIGVGLSVLGALALIALVLGLAGLHRRDQVVERRGTGANIVLLLDRSSSMDSTFANRSPDGKEESKSVAARRLLTDFAARRPADRVAVAAFSTSPMPIVPMTDRHEAVRAAIAAIDRPGLAHTDVGRGLALAFSMFDDASSESSRALVLVSDGAAVIDRRVQDALRDAAARDPVRLYWLFLRTQGSKGIYDKPPPGEPDVPQTYPERHLDIFFKSLGLPYRAFEARGAAEVSAAIKEIDQLEQRPTTYFETVPRQDLDWLCYWVAALASALLLGAKLLERRLDEPAAGRDLRSAS